MRRARHLHPGGKPNWFAFLPPQIRMRRATLSDRAVRSILFAETCQTGHPALAAGSDATRHTFIAEQFRRREAHCARHHPDADVLMIEARGGPGGRFAIVGTLSLELDNRPDGTRIARLITIEIGAASRGRGIGSQVINAVAETAAACACDRLELSFDIIDARTEAFWQRLGFRHLDPDESSSDAPGIDADTMTATTGLRRLALRFGD